MLEDSVFRQLIESAPDAIIVVDGDGQMILVNEETERLFGYAQREMIGRPIEVLVPSHLRAAHNTDRSAYLQRAHPRPMGAGLTLMARHKDGHEIPVEISLSPVESTHGRIVAAMVRNITDRRRAQDIIRSQAEVLEHAHDAIIVLDMGLCIQYWNSGAEQTYGWTAAEALGKDIHKLLETTPVNSTIEDVSGILVRESRWEGELEQTAQDGRRIIVASRRTVRHASGGESSSILEIDRDITDRKLIERERAVMQLEIQRQQDRDRIAMDLHDGVIQSIYAVGLNLESAAHDIATHPKAVSAQIDESIESLHSVINDIRGYIFQLQRPGLGGDLGTALRALAGNVEKSGGVPVHVDIDGVPAAMGDDHRFALYHVTQEALANILRHAQASQVSISLCASADGVMLVVEDDGVGFDASADAGDRHHGVRNMHARAEAVGGELAIESAPGRGSRIRFRLPA